MKAVDVLRAARDLISDPARWTQGTFARDSGGFEVASNDPGATCFCALGALQRACDMSMWMDVTLTLLRRAVPKVHAWYIFPSEVNDNLGHASVLKMFDIAIELAADDDTLPELPSFDEDSQ